MVNIGPFEHDLRLNMYWRQENHVRCSILDLKAHCKHIITPFRSEQYTKRRVNDDPCDLEKWSILNLLSTSRGGLPEVRKALTPSYAMPYFKSLRCAVMFRARFHLLLLV